MPDDGRAAFNAGLALAQVGRPAEAERMLRRAVEVESSRYEHLFALGGFLLRQGRLAEVGPIADYVAALDPVRPEAAQLERFLGPRWGESHRGPPT